MYRLFIALDVGHDTDARLDVLVTAAQRDAAGELRPVSRGRRHLTLRFLGDTDPDQVDAIVSDLAGAVEGVVPFEMLVQGAGAFPDPRRARVLWAGIATGAQEIVDLAARVDAVLASEHGFEPEARRFHPHVTVGRFRGRPVDVSRVLTQFADTRWGVDRVREVQLIRSQLHRGGPSYTVFARVPLVRG